MAGDGEAIWHVIIGEKQEQEGPLTEAQILAYLEGGVLTGSDLIWRLGFTDWKQVSEIDEFRLPEEPDSLREPARTHAPVLSASERSYQFPRFLSVRSRLVLLDGSVGVWHLRPPLRIEKLLSCDGHFVARNQRPR